MALALAKGRDPATLYGESLVRYAKEWWLTASPCKPPGVLTPLQLVQGFRSGAAGFDPQLPWAKSVQGPMSAALYACAIVGWKFASASCVVDEWGRRWQLQECPPCTLRSLFAAALRRQATAQELAAYLEGHADAAGPDEVVRGQSLWWEALRRAM